MTKQPAKAAKTKMKKLVKDCHALRDLCSRIAFEGVITVDTL